MPISVYLDNNVWDFLFARNLDLSVELPRAEYSLYLTREAEFEIPPIPPARAALKVFIEDTIAACDIDTHSYFGFNDPTLSPEDQRVGGFGVGYWISNRERDFINNQQVRLGAIKKPSTRLYKNEADISLGARSFTSVVLSLDDKAGPLKDAQAQGGKVVFLTDFDISGLSLSDFIKSRI
jgi:hypothetical protein